MINERVFHLSGHETAEELCETIKNAKVDTLFFSFPRSSYLFRHKTTFLLLRTCAEEHGKTLIVITLNALARQEIQALGIETFSSLEDREKTPFEKNRENFQSPNIAYIPIDPSKMEKPKSKKDDIKKEKSFFARPTIHAMLILASMAMALFVFILQIAIPSGKIVIDPAKKQEEMHLNVYFLSKYQYEEKDLWKKNNGIFMTPLEKVFVYESTYSNVSKNSSGENASGRIVLFNNTANEITLRGETRVQNEEGILFFLDTWAKIPANGSTEVSVTASDMDAYGKMQGERGNIEKGTDLIIPGLNEETRKEIFGKTLTNFTGGKTDWVYNVTKQDLEKAKEKWAKEATEKGVNEIEFLFSQLQENEEEEYRLLPMDGPQVELEILEVLYSSPEEELIGQDLASFSGSVRVRVQNSAYSLEHLHDLFWAKYQRIAPDGMTLVSVDTSLFSPRIQKVNNKDGEIKVSFSTSGVYEYIMEQKSQKGYFFVQKVKEEVLNKPRLEAMDVLQNMREVEEVSIELWPFWVRSLPTLPEKIEVEIL